MDMMDPLSDDNYPTSGTETTKATAQGNENTDESTEEHQFIPLGEYQGPEETAVPSSSASPPLRKGSSQKQDSIFEFHDVTNVSKVHQDSSLKLDYWSYEVVLETDYEVYRKPRGTTDLVTVVSRRRYKEFEWLREALVVEYPYSIVPPLPGFALEGMLEKVDNVLGTVEQTPEVPALVTYRMRGISLFIKWLAKCPNLRASPLLQCFMELSSEELATFQASCKKPAKPGPSTFGKLSFSNVWGSLQRTLKGPPKVLNENVLQAKMLLGNLEAALAQLKDQVEKLWDQIVNLCEGYAVERLDQSLSKADEVIQALVKTGVVVKRAAHSFSVENEELFLALVIDLSFYGGLATSAKTVACTLERMAGDLEHLQNAKKASEAQELQNDLETGCETFLEEYRRFHQTKKPAIKKMVYNFALLATNMDPKNFSWEKYCTPLIAHIPDPEW